MHERKVYLLLVAFVAPSSAHRDPSLLHRSQSIAIASPPQSGFAAHAAIAESAIRYPLLHDVLDELNLATEVIGCWNTLEG